MSFMRKHEQLALTIEQWANNIGEILRRAREYCKPSPLVQSLIPESEMEESQKAVKSWCERLKKTYGALCDLSNETAMQLEHKLTAFQIRSLFDNLTEWLHNQITRATSNETGSDLESSSRLCLYFQELSRQVDSDGSAMVRDICAKADHLIMSMHADSEAISICKDRINEQWADLKELLQTRNLMLSADRDMHRFLCDCQHLQEQIEYRLKNMPPIPADEVIADKPSKHSKKLVGLSVLQRSYTALDHELVCMSKQVDVLNDTAKKVIPLYAGEVEETLRQNIVNVMEKWNRLIGLSEERKLLLDKATELNHFLKTARYLIAYMESTKNDMETQERPKDVEGVENLILEHRNLMEELKTKSQSIEDCLNLGRRLLPAPETEPTRDDLIGPRAEVRERCVQLATGHLLLGELWRERWDRLHLLLEVRQYCKDSNACFEWLRERELKLSTARNKLGDNLSETLTLLGAHYAFERVILGAEERFQALKKLTVLEVRSMEWRSEDAVKQEQRKRNKIREVVQEFMVPPTKPAVITPVVSSVPMSKILTERKELSPRTGRVREPLKAFQETVQDLPDQSVSPSMEYLKPSQSPTEKSPSDSATENSHPRKLLRKLPETTIKPVKSKEGRKKVRRTRSKRPNRERSTPLDSEDSDQHEKTELPSSRLSASSITSSTKSSGTTETSSDLKDFSRRLGTLEEFGKPIHESSLKETKPDTAIAHESTSKSSSSLTARKHDVDVGGRRRSRSEGRSWNNVYLVLEGSTLSTYRDHRSRKYKPEMYYRNEMPMDLAYAQIYVAADYHKHPFVFRLSLSEGTEYLFRAASDEVMHKWISAITEAARIVTKQRQHETMPSKSSTLPRGSKSPTGSLTSFSRRSLSRIFKR
ncbi:hypothetical protein Ciccas_002083 [Cichlidogyrus casuarinus]|uniref:PH domain-containing protein n=1 Tax=Cichlidogyrus casuarinus TaxID=1844966 RepID=A0ABD2QI99_9PLAT